MSAVLPPPADGNRMSPRTFGRLLALVIAAFLVFRLPLMYRTPGGIDEEQYAVPGLTILKTGIPQMPQYPARNPHSVFYHSDRVMFTMPPLYFYLQSLFYLVLPAVYGTARLCTASAGIAVLILTAVLARRWTGNGLAGVVAAGLLSFSRVFYDYATRARPDMLCTALGLAAVLATCRWLDQRTRSRLLLVGVLLGLGGLTHPFAIAYAIQIGLWILLESRGWHRLINPAAAAMTALAVFSLWIPLILIDLEAFRTVMGNQYGVSNSHGLLGRILNPIQSLWFHQAYMFEYIGWWQVKLLFVPAIACTVFCLFHPAPKLRTVCLLAWSALYLMCTCAGTFHLTWGYFTYPGALLLICAGAVVSWILRELWKGAVLGRWIPVSWPDRALAAVCVVLLAGSMLFGSQITVLVRYLRNWNDINYNAPRFAQQLLADLPADARYTVDKEFLLDFYAAGRQVIAAEWVPFYFSAEARPYDYFVGGRFARGNVVTQPDQRRGKAAVVLSDIMCGELIERRGVESDVYACFAEVYKPASQPCAPVEYELPHWIRSQPATPYWARPQEVGNSPHPTPAPADTP